MTEFKNQHDLADAGLIRGKSCTLQVDDVAYYGLRILNACY